jgi:transcriptional regulator GlxA family with amidase domain
VWLSLSTSSDMPGQANNARRWLPRLTEVLALPQAQLLDVAGPIQVFTAANELAAKAKAQTPYAIRVVAPKGAQLQAASGLTFVTAPLPDPAEPVGTLIVAGG